MKKYFLISLCALCFSFFANAEERILVLENPNNTLAEKAWDAALMDLQMQNRDLLIASFISENKDRFSAIDMQRINVSLGELSDTQLTLIANNSYKDPTTSLITLSWKATMQLSRFPYLHHGQERQLSNWTCAKGTTSICWRPNRTTSSTP